jgi:branched-chain amino acid transport system ATP-binding protein
MVALGRGLMAQPDVLAIDEMSLGLAPLVVRDIGRKLKELNATRGLAVLLVEQNARLALSLCNMAYVLETGRLVAQGRCDQLIQSPLVLEAYLGSQPGAAS